MTGSLVPTVWFSGSSDCADHFPKCWLTLNDDLTSKLMFSAHFKGTNPCSLYWYPVATTRQNSESQSL